MRDVMDLGALDQGARVLQQLIYGCRALQPVHDQLCLAPASCPAQRSSGALKLLVQSRLDMQDEDSPGGSVHLKTEAISRVAS